jgi:excisionase family DNA binding protein
MDIQPVRFLSSGEVALRLGVSPRTIQRWIKGGKFPNSYRLGASTRAPYLIPQRDLAAHLERLQETQTAP